MKKSLMILLIAIVATGLVLVIGCSKDDEETTQPVVKQTGDPNAEEFEATGAAFGFIEMLNQEMFGFMFETIDTILNDPGFPVASKGRFAVFSTGTTSDTIFLTYHAGSQYWYLYAQAVDTETIELEDVIITLTVTDSIQFLHGAIPVQWPDSALLTGVKNGASMEMSFSNEMASIDAHQRITVMGDLPGYGDIEVDGNSSFDVYMSMDGVEQSCTFDMNLSSTLTDIMMNLVNMDAGGCPSSGRASYGGAINLACQGDTTFTFNDNWSVVQTFTGTTIQYVVENSTHRWEFEEPCGVVKAPGNAITEFLTRLR